MSRTTLFLAFALLIFAHPSSAENQTKSDWQKAVADNTAAGGSLDLKDFTPATIPDEQNYAAAAFLKGITIPDNVAHPSGLDGKSVRATFDEISNLLEMPDIDEELFDEWVENEDPRKPLPLRFWVKLLSRNAGRPLKIDPITSTDTQIAAEILAVIDSKFGSLLTASDRAALRTKSTWVLPTTDFYDLEDPNEGTINHANSAIVFSRLLKLRARAAAHADKPEITARSIDAIFHLARSERPYPRAIIQFLVSTTLNRTAQSALRECLVKPIFDDATIAHFIEKIESTDAISDCVDAFLAELIFLSAIVAKLEKNDSRQLLGGIEMLGELGFGGSTKEELQKWSEDMKPGAWEEIGAFLLPEIHRTAIIPLASGDVVSFRKLQSDLNGRILAKQKSGPDRWKLAFAVQFEDNSVYEGVGRSAVKLGAESRMAQIACALERHYLKNGTYPDTLEDLTPKFLKSIPTDPVNSKPLRYLRLGKNYRLYSVAWDSIDHGGKPENRSNPEDRGHDWVWPRFELQPKSP